MHHVGRSLSLSLNLLALLAPVAPLSAQNLFEVYPTRPNISTTDYTRLGIPFSAGGEILVEVQPMHFCNVGGNGTCACSITGIDVTLLDLDDSTADTFFGVVRVVGTAGPPLCISLPMNTTIGSGGPSVETYSVPMPCAIPCNAVFYFGIEVQASACNDGIYVTAARYSGVAGCGGETARSGAPSLLFSGPVALAVPWLGPKLFSLRMGVTTDGPVLNMGNQAAIISPPCAPWSTGYGVGGSYPSMIPFFEDSLWARIQDVASPNGTAVLFVSPAPPIAVCLPPFGLLCIAPMLQLCPITLDGNGLGTCRVLQLKPAWAGSTLWFQAASAGSGLLTNAQAVKL